MHYLYVLYSFKDKKTYIGQSNDLRRRFKEHTNGLVPSTKSRRPLMLIYYEAFLIGEVAKDQEKLYKTGQGRRILKKRLTKIIESLKD